MSALAQSQGQLPPALEHGTVYRLDHDGRLQRAEGNRGLTYRQMQMLSMAATGMTIDEISSACHVAYGTTDNTMRNMRERLGARNTAHAIALGIAFEIISVGPDGEVVIPDRFNYLSAV